MVDIRNLSIEYMHNGTMLTKPEAQILQHLICRFETMSHMNTYTEGRTQIGGIYKRWWGEHLRFKVAIHRVVVTPAYRNTDTQA